MKIFYLQKIYEDTKIMEVEHILFILWPTHIYIYEDS
jgi:hypothetical protein